jgi:heptosyltransferase-2
MKIAIFLPNWIGDAVMATPTLRAMRDQYPAAEIVGVMRPYVADVLAGAGLIDRRVFYNPRSKDPTQRDNAVAHALHAEQFDLALLLPNSLRTGLLAWRSGAKRRIGFARDLRGWLLTDRVTPKPKSMPHPVIDEYLRLAEHLGCRNLTRKTELTVLPEDQSRLDEFWSGRWVIEHGAWKEVGNQQAPSYVCLNTGGAFGAAKNWPKEYFSELARRIAYQLNKLVLVVCGPSERDDARWIAADACHPSVLSLADVPLSIGLTKAAIRSAELLVTTDSGPRHFAAPFGTPVLTLFGPTHIAWSETYYDRAEHLQLKLDCGPCQQRECPLKHHRCLRNLTVDTVFAAVQRQLDKNDLKRRVA